MALWDSITPLGSPGHGRNPQQSAASNPQHVVTREDKVVTRGDNVVAKAFTHWVYGVTCGGEPGVLLKTFIQPKQLKQ